jgi:hypothetical protein
MLSMNLSGQCRELSRSATTASTKPTSLRGDLLARRLLTGVFVQEEAMMKKSAIFSLTFCMTTIGCSTASHPRDAAALDPVPDHAGPKVMPNVQVSPPGTLGVEPALALDPANPSQLVAAWIHPRSIQGSVSRDGGRSWGTAHDFPWQITDAQAYSADPTVAWSPGGATAYVAYINADKNPTTGSPFGAAGTILFSRSSDHGATWSDPVLVRDISRTSDWGDDRPWMTVDHSGGPRDGWIYLTTHTGARTGPTAHVHLTISRDRGATWTTSDIQVDDSTYPAFAATTANPTVGEFGALYIVYLASAGCTLPMLCTVVARSTDGGATFTRTLAPSINYLVRPGLVLAANPTVAGDLAMVWIDGRYGDPDILFARSMDSGATWSDPIRINDDAIGNGITQDQPWIAYSPTGTIGIAWRDRRLSERTDPLAPFDVYYTYSKDRGAHFAPNIRLSDASSPVMMNVTMGNDFLGVALTNTKLVADWADYRSGMVFQIYSGGGTTP